MKQKKFETLNLKLKTQSLKRSDALQLDEFAEQLKNAGAILEKLTRQCQPSKEAVVHWHKLVSAWAADQTMPLYIRKINAKYARGAEFKHKKTGRLIICADNGPAHWTIAMAANENLLELEQVKMMIAADAIPIAFALGSREKDSKYRFCKHEVDFPNKKGWKVSHIKEIGLGTRKPITELPIAELKEHFINFLSPANMFLVPLQYGGLAEVAEVIEVFDRKRTA